MAYSKRFNMIALQMAYGLKRRKITPVQLQAFKNRFKHIVGWIEENTPDINSAARGAIAKAALWFGRDTLKPFCETLKSKNFKGASDPAHVLWLKLKGRGKNTPKDVYAVAISAIRAFLKDNCINSRTRDGEIIKPELFPAYTDFFEWNASFTKMILERKIGKNKISTIKVANDEVTKWKEPELVGAE